MYTFSLIVYIIRFKSSTSLLKCSLYQREQGDEISQELLDLKIENEFPDWLRAYVI